MATRAVTKPRTKHQLETEIRDAIRLEHQLETEIQDAIRLELGDVEQYPDVLLYRNNVGVLQDKDDRYVRFGLCPGSADLIGIFTRSGVGIFIAAEIKTPTGKQKPEQKRFEQLVTNKGGSYAVLRSVEDARAWVARLRSGER